VPLDDLGFHVEPPPVVRRVVSLVPSLTEALAATDQSLLVGATDWCSHPADLAVTRVRGTKNPDLAAIVELAPDLVIANEEENRVPDIDALRSAGLAVWVTRVRTVEEAFASLTRLLTVAVGRDAPPAWLTDARQAWAAVPPTPHRTALIPIWRRPWMFVGSDTFAGDVLRRLGVVNALADHADRYPKIALEELPSVELVILPDEPYRFTETDGPESFVGTQVALVSGRHLTWYGPSLRAAPGALSASLAAAWLVASPD
jgi:ABC-type Fe3+-hydroxamate transport system substrate-binding protein